MNPNSFTIQEAAAVLKEANEKIRVLLTAQKDLQTYAEVTYNRIAQIEKSMYGLAGLPNSSAINVDTLFEPLTKVMGIPVDTRKPVSEKDLQPTLTDKERFLKKVSDFYDRLPTLSDMKVLEILREPQGESILRGVAKRAGVENWKEFPLDIVFVAEIKDAIASKSEIDAADNKAKTFTNAFDQDAVQTHPWSKEIPEGGDNKPTSAFHGTDHDGDKLPLQPLKEVEASPFQKKQQDEDKELQKSGEHDSSDETGASKEAAGAENPMVTKAKQLKEEGKSNKEIAEILDLSQTTISNYLKK